MTEPYPCLPSLLRCSYSQGKRDIPNYKLVSFFIANIHRWHTIATMSSFLLSHHFFPNKLAATLGWQWSFCICYTAAGHYTIVILQGKVNLVSSTDHVVPWCISLVIQSLSLHFKINIKERCLKVFCWFHFTSAGVIMRLLCTILRTQKAIKELFRFFCLWVVFYQIL